MLIPFHCKKILTHIFTFKFKKQTTLHINVQEWNDYNLRWNETEYGGVKDLRITPNKLWKPDVLMYNSADEGFDGTYHTNVVVKHDGGCLYVPPGIFKSTCKIDITWFPFDDQHCEMKFGSWTYDGNQVKKNCGQNQKKKFDVCSIGTILYYFLLFKVI
uniref:CSON009230 protein n=1 Tax=Culicoides sonorensis TaxID=179676 RepID=A0A336M2F1_CULSO